METVRVMNTRSIISSDGFTIIEILIALVMSSLVLVAILGAHEVQQNYSLAQEQVTEMQQNLRTGLNTLAREARYAGYDPDDKGYGITSITATGFSFTMDNDDGGQDQRTFNLYDPGDKDADDTTSVRMTTGPGAIAIANNIEKLEFEYFDENNLVTTDPTEVRSIRIHMLARADNPDRKFTNTATYVFPSGNYGPINDNFRRRMQVITIKLRNMGLNDA